MHIVYLGLGSNMGHRERNIRLAIEKIEEQIGAVVRQSALCVTAPWGFRSARQFVNAAICVETKLTPRELLMATQQIERQMGRRHKTRKGDDGLPAEGTTYHDRTIDIDILLYDDLHIDEPDLKVPHPLMRQRPFVMQPLSEILPNAGESDNESK